MFGKKQKSRHSRRKSLLHRFIIHPVLASFNWLRWSLGRPWFWVQSFFALCGILIKVWWRQRDRKSILYGIPFLLLSVGVGYLAVASSLYPQDQLYDDYLQSAKKSFEEKEYRHARLLYDRVVQIDSQVNSQDDETLFQLALAAGQTGNIERSSVIIQQLAPDDKPRYAAAHLSRAKGILGDRTVHPASRLVYAQPHLLHAIAASPNSEKARYYLAETYYKQGQWEDAIKHYLLVVDKIPRLRLQLAKAYAFANDAERARTQGEIVKEYFSNRLAKKPQDYKTRLDLAETLRFLEQFPKAVQVVSEGLPFGNTKELKAIMPSIYISWSDSLPNDTIAQRRVRFGLLSKALTYTNRDILLFDRIMKILERQDQLSKDAKELLRENITSGDLPPSSVALSYLLLGTSEGKDGHSKKAIFHLKQAQSIDKASFIIANNLAWYLAVKDDAELDLALHVINQTIENATVKHSQFYDTQGFILHQMGKYESALDAYVKGRAGLRNDPDFHKRIAETYDKLEQPELAKSSREKAKKIVEQLAQQKEREQGNP